MQVSVRPIQPADHLRWAELWRAYQAFYGVDLPQAVTEATWQRLLDDREPVFGLVAEKDGNVIGITWTPDVRPSGAGRRLLGQGPRKGRTATYTQFSVRRRQLTLHRSHADDELSGDLAV